MNTVGLMVSLLAYLEGHSDIAPLLSQTKIATNYIDYKGLSPEQGSISLFLGLADSSNQGRSADLDGEVAECCLAQKGIDELHADIYSHTVQLLMKTTRFCRHGITYEEGAGLSEEAVQKLVGALNGATAIDADGKIGLFSSVVNLIDRSSPKEDQQGGSSICDETLIEVEFWTGENRVRCS